MQKITDPRVLAQIENDLEQAYMGCFNLGVGLPNYEWFEESGLTWFCSHLEEKFLNGVFCCVVQVQKLDDCVDRITRFFKSRNLPALWRLLPNTKNKKELAKSLEASGWIKDDSFTTVYASLDSLADDKSAAATLRSLSMSTVIDRESFDEWYKPFMSAFDLRLDSADFFYAFFKKAGFGDTSVFPAYYLTLNGRPVACISVFKTSGITGGVFNVGVDKAFRGHGYGKAIALHAGLKLKEFGYRFAGQFASSQGLPVYQKLGCHPISEHLSYQI